jgi:hypothetical protein
LKTAIVTKPSNITATVIATKTLPQNTKTKTEDKARYQDKVKATQDKDKARQRLMTRH